MITRAVGFVLDVVLGCVGLVVVYFVLPPDLRRRDP